MVTLNTEKLCNWPVASHVIGFGTIASHLCKALIHLPLLIKKRIEFSHYNTEYKKCYFASSSNANLQKWDEVVKKLNELNQPLIRNDLRSIGKGIVCLLYPIGPIYNWAQQRKATSVEEVD
jgi:hypothetical protein